MLRARAEKYAQRRLNEREYKILCDEIRAYQDFKLANLEQLMFEIGLAPATEYGIIDWDSIFRKEVETLDREEIKRIRSKFGLSQKVFSKLLGWGEVTIGRYERGTSIASTAHVTIFNMLSENTSLISYFYRSTKDSFTDQERRMIESKLIEIGVDINSPIAQ